MLFSVFSIAYLAIALLCWTLVAFSLWRLRYLVTGNLTALLFLMGFWSFLTGLELQATSISTQLLITRLAYISYAMTTPCWVLFLREYATKRPQRRNPWVIALFVVFAGMIVLQWTNPNHFFYSRISLERVAGRTFFRAVYGPGFWLFFALSHVTLVTTCLWLVLRYRRQQLDGRHVLLMVVAVFLPTLANLPYVFRLFPIDLTPVGFLGCCALLVALYREEFVMELLPSRRTLLDAIGDGAILRDTKDRVVWMNRAAHELLALGDTPADLERAEKLLTAWLSEPDAEGSGGQMVVFAHPERGPCHYLLRRTPLRDGLPDHHNSLLLLQDSTALNRAQERVHQLEHFDEVTGLYSRHYFMQLLEDAIRQARDHGQSLAVLCATIINYQDYCSLYGSPFCDSLLNAVGKRLQALLRRSDAISRFSDDEFYLYFYFHDAPENIDAHVRSAVARVWSLFEQPLEVAGITIQLRLRAGAAYCPHHACDPNLLINMARSAKRSAKLQHQRQFIVYTPDMGMAFSRYVRLEQDLHHALEREELWLMYQPQVHILTHRVIGVEALLRWRHPELGNIPPNDFIPIAEEKGDIHDIGLWVVEQAVAQLKKWHDMGLTDLRVSVNVSLSQLIHPEFSNKVLQLVRQGQVPPATVELELTESLALFPEAQTHDHLSQLRSQGLRLAMDDFGMGHSSLTYIKEFSMDTVKIDRALATDILQDSTSLAMVRSVQSLCSSIGLDLVVEYIEEPEQLDLLKELGCYVVQGYVFSPPLTGEDCTRFLVRANLEGEKAPACDAPLLK